MWCTCLNVVSKEGYATLTCLRSTTYVDCSTPHPPEKPLTIAFTLCVTSGEIVKQDGGGPIDEDFVGAGVRLRNSDVLANLDNKLSHLSTGERNDAACLIHEFTHLFPDIPKRIKVVIHEVDVGNQVHVNSSHIG